MEYIEEGQETKGSRLMEKWGGQPLKALTARIKKSVYYPNSYEYAWGADRLCCGTVAKTPGRRDAV